MRAYVSVTPVELQTLLSDGILKVAQAFVVEAESEGTPARDEADQEEFEFEASWNAALLSRQRQVSDNAFGLALAVDLEKGQMGNIEGGQVWLLSNLSLKQVQSLLVAESSEMELSWFAPQEIANYLPNWLA